MVKMIKSILAVYYYLAGRMLAASFYGKKYCTGRHFAHKNSPGWKWVVDDFWGCLKLKVNWGQRNYWPASPRIQVVEPRNIIFSPDDLNNFQGFGNYYQAIGTITIGKGSYIAPNVGLITANHDLNDLDKQTEAKPIILGERCWIGMNSMILPGVCLGEHTIVGAGSVVTKSFPEGHCVIAGNPARIIRKLDSEPNATGHELHSKIRSHHEICTDRLWPHCCKSHKGRN